MQHVGRWALVLVVVLLALPQTRAEEAPPAVLEETPPEIVAHVDMRVIEMPPRRLAGYLGHMRNDKAPIIRPLELEEARALLEAARRRGDMRVRDWVRTTTRMEQAVILDDTIRESYVQDYELEITTGSSSVTDPLIGTLVEGVTLEAHARLRKHDMALRIKGTWGAVVRPIPLYTTRIGAGEEDDQQEITIQLPELRVDQLDEEIAFKGEGWWLVATRVHHRDEYGQKTARVALLHARRMTYSQPQVSANLGAR